MTATALTEPHWDWRTDLRDGGLLAALLALYVAAPGWLAIPVTLALVMAAWRRLDLALLLVILIAPTYLTPKEFDLSLLGRTLPFKVSLAEYALLVCAAAAAVRRWRMPNGAPPADGPGWRTALLPPAALVGAATITLPFAQHLTEALREYRTMLVEPALYYVLIVTTWRSLTDVWRALYALTAMGAGMALYSLYHYFIVGAGEVTGGVRRILAIYHSPNALALFLGRLIPIAAAQTLFGAVIRRSRALALAPAAALALVLVAFYFTYSRGAMAGIAAGVLLVLAGWRPKAALLGAAVGAVLLLVVLPGLAAERMAQAVPLLQRVYVWQAALAMAADHPIVGVGPDNFLYHYPQYILAEAKFEPFMSHPHNLLLDFWLRSGILGLAALVGVQYWFWSRVRRLAAHPNGWVKWAALALAASMVDFLVHGLIDNSYFLIDLAYMFWLTLALVTVLNQAAAPVPVRADQP